MESFDDGKGGLSRSWVKGGVVNHGKGNNCEYCFDYLYFNLYNAMGHSALASGRLAQ